MVEEMEAEYLAGFIDAEGSLRCGILPCKTMELKYQIQPTITLEQHLPKYLAGMLDGDGLISIGANEDLTTKVGFNLQSVIKFYNTNSLLKEVLIQFGKLKGIRVGFSMNQKVLVARITGRKDVKKCLEVLFPYLILKKQQASLLLQIIEKQEKGIHLTKNGFLEVMKLHDALCFLHGQNQKRKYSYKYFKNLW